MAQFRGIVKSNEGETSRLGSKDGGLITEANGWDIGSKTVLTHKDGKDIIEIYKTRGSNNSNNDELLFSSEIQKNYHV